MDASLARSYRSTRRADPHLPAATALAIARRQQWPIWAEHFVQREHGDIVLQGSVAGRLVNIRTEVDQDADHSFLGEFTNDPYEAIPNPEYQHGRYRFFRPEWTMVSSLASLRRTHSRTEARAVRDREVQEMARAALQDQHIAIVEVLDNDGAVLGEASLAGCFVDNAADLLWVVDDHGMIAEALDNAGRSVDTDAA